MRACFRRVTELVHYFDESNAFIGLPFRVWDNCSSLFKSLEHLFTDAKPLLVSLLVSDCFLEMLQVTKGLDVVDMIEGVGSQSGKTSSKVIVKDCGEL